MRRWEFVGGRSERFWEAGLSGTVVTMRDGRIATNGQTNVERFGSVEEAESYLAQAIADKERAGYVEVAAPPDPAPVPRPASRPTSRSASRPGSPSASRPGSAPASRPGSPPASRSASRPGPRPASPVVERPDEERFEFPGSWRRVLHPRRGGIARPPAVVDPAAVAEVATWTREGNHLVREALADPGSDRQLVKELQSHIDRAETPRGAALVAHLVAVRHYLDRGKLADAWVAAHGLVFAAQTIMELLEVEVDWNSGLTRKNSPRLRYRQAGAPLGWHWPWRATAERLRALLVSADDHEYGAVTDTLARRRAGVPQRIVASYLVPTESAWTDECCAQPPAADDTVAITLLFCALGSARQADMLGPHARFGWGQWSLDVIATTVEGIGARIAPMLVGALDGDSGGADARKMVLGVLSRLPTDEAFQIMVDRIDDKYVQPALLEAMRRFPVRALRLLARAAGGSSASSASAGRLLSGHLLAVPELVAAALPGLPDDVRAVVEGVSKAVVRVPEAPPGSLPRLLVQPPWTRRRSTAARVVVTGLVPPPESRVRWRPGERDEWASPRPASPRPASPGSASPDSASSGSASPGSHSGRWTDNDWDVAVRRYTDAGRRGLSGHEEAALFADGPEHLVRPLLATWKPRYPWYAEIRMKPVVARYEAAALAPVLEIATANPASSGSLLIPFFDVRVARLMADWLIRLKSGRGTALAWLARHGAEAVRLLVPDAVGPAGRARSGAEAALRAVAAMTGDSAVVEAARTYGGEAAEAVRAMLSCDPLDNVPAHMPKPGAWADPALLPQVLLRDRRHALPLPAVQHVLTMLALSRSGEVYPGLHVVREVCDPASLAEFGWEVFERWCTAGLPTKDGWALTGLGWIGDDETVRRLTPVIRAWPGEGGHQRAAAGLDVLAAIGTETALTHLGDIAQGVRFKGLRARAREKIQEVAEGLGLTEEQLADRLVPGLGLDDDGSLVLDYGPRRFAVGFDERLTPYVLDESGRRRKDPPAPGVHDDADKARTARKRFTALRKDVRAVADDLIGRLEAAMGARRTWTAAEFGGLLAGHPLTGHLARRLVWVAVADGAEREFRVAEDRTLADVEDGALTLPEDASVRLAHPLEMGATLDTWVEVLARHEIIQPFPQLRRPPS